jgi:hypothetical protein
VALEFDYNGETYKGEAIPIPETCSDGICHQLDITLNDEHLGIIRALKSGWKWMEWMIRNWLMLLQNRS